MKILAFTDFHGNRTAYEKAKEIIAKKKPDFVIVAGDVTNYDINRAQQFLRNLAEAGSNIYFVPGNMDDPQLKDWSEKPNIEGLHGRCLYSKGIALIGLGGSPHGSFSTPFEYSEHEAAQLLDEAMKANSGGKLILVSHCPPMNTKIDVAYSGSHAGSNSVRKFVEKTQPLLIISGHIHEAQGVDAIGNTTIVNTGPAQRGDFAEIDLDGKTTVIFAKLF